MSINISVTVITVVKDAANDLEQTILSVLALKTSYHIKIIVVDGGSKDNTLDIIRKYENNIFHWISENDAGIYDAMNKGWSAADSNSYILFLGAGDRLISLPTDLNLYKHNEIIYGDVYAGNNFKFKSRAGIVLKLYNSLHHQALMIPKMLHPTPPFNIQFKVFADFDLNQRLMKHGYCFVWSPLFYSYALPGGASDEDHFEESLRVIYKNFGWLWAMLALCCYVLIRYIPFLSALKPYKKIRSVD